MVVINRIDAVRLKMSAVAITKNVPHLSLITFQQNVKSMLSLRNVNLRNIEDEMGDDYILDLKKHYVTIPKEKRHDLIPKFLAGVNIADYIDADIFEKLEELERDEDDTLAKIRDMARQI